MMEKTGIGVAPKEEAITSDREQLKELQLIEEPENCTE